MRLTNLCVSEPFFECELGTYVQEEGAPMGGPLSGLLADLIIENKIEKQIATHPRWGKLVDWIRKADDTFLEWTGTLHDLNDFHTFLNSLHPTIIWTMELEKDNQIPFLDVLIIKSPPELLTTVYRICSASTRYIHFTSSQVWSEKTAALKTLRRRAEDYCSTPHLLQEELQLLTQIFLQNGFPAQTIHRILHKETPSTHPHTNPDEHPEETTNPPPPSSPHSTLLPQDYSKPFGPNSTFPPSTQRPQLLATSSSKDARTSLSTHQALSMPSPVNAPNSTLVKQNAQQLSEFLKKQLLVPKLIEPISFQPTNKPTLASQLTIN
jgi:hypothetical protein